MWTGGLPHLPGVPHLRVNRPILLCPFAKALEGFTRCACRAVVLLINPVVIDVFVVVVVVALKFKSSFNGMNANLIECYTHTKQA